MDPPRGRRPRSLGMLTVTVFAMIAFALAVVTVNLGPSAIPIWLFVSFTAIAISYSPIGKAIALGHRGEGGFAREVLPPGEGEGTDSLYDSLYQEIDQLHHRLEELEQRQDFAERLLASGKDHSPTT